MNSPLSLARDRQFWTGVGAMLVVTIAVMAGMPRYLAGSKSASARLGASLESQALSIGHASGGGYGARKTMEFLSPVESPGYDERKMIRNASMDVVVKRPKEASDNIRQLAEKAGGFLVSAEVNGGDNALSASLTIRVPVSKFEEIRASISKLGVRVEGEKLEAQDATKQYVDLVAQLRNLRAQETQYLGILKQAKTVKDTVEVSDKLNEVRTQIDQQQAEFEALSKQVETIALTLSLRAESDVQVFGLHWRPLYRLKETIRDGIDGIADYASAMASFLFFIPALVLWIATILIGAAVAWRILRWVWRVLFTSRAPKALR